MKTLAMAINTYAYFGKEVAVAVAVADELDKKDKEVVPFPVLFPTLENKNTKSIMTIIKITNMVGLNGILFKKV
tara:strand:+ start:658 stop:879 length:222 start_codon:yes stop_codon:yes gene_type:complete